ncbi:Arc family DNA-binding protein [Pseudochelatococcus sp. B33]
MVKIGQSRDATDLRPGRGADQFPLRFPDGMREQLKAEAAKNGRSLNAEIIDRLSKSLEGSDSIAQLPGAIGGGAVTSIDEIAKVVVAKLAERSGVIPERDKERFFESYETAKRTETRNLRSFMDAATDVLERKRDE